MVNLCFIGATLIQLNHWWVVWQFPNLNSCNSWNRLINTNKCCFDFSSGRMLKMSLIIGGADSTELEKRCGRYRSRNPQSQCCWCCLKKKRHPDPLGNSLRDVSGKISKLVDLSLRTLNFFLWFFLFHFIFSPSSSFFFFFFLFFFLENFRMLETLI